MILGGILVVVILFAPEGLYARLRDDPGAPFSRA